MLAEYDENGTLTTNYTRADELISQERDGAKSYYLYDGSDSVRMLANEDGEITDTYTFDAFGNLTASTGSTKNDFLYRGEQYDSFTGLYYLRARYMNPATGTFITMDEYAGSVFEPVSLHKYLYANANPVMYSDPSGYEATLRECTVGLAMVAVTAGIVYAVIRFSDIIPSYNDLGYNTVLNGDNILDWSEGLGRGTSISLTIGQSIIISSIDDSTDDAIPDEIEIDKNDDKRIILYHYTNQEGMYGILTSGVIHPSLRENNPKDARHGDGQYLSDILPFTTTPIYLAKKFINRPNKYKYTHFVAIDVTDLNVIPCRENVYLIPNKEDLYVRDIIVGYGKVGA